jgi:hypothetical protein
LTSGPFFEVPSHPRCKQTDEIVGADIGDVPNELELTTTTPAPGSRRADFPAASPGSATVKDGSIVIARCRRDLSPSAHAVAPLPKASVRTRTVASLHAFVTGHVEPKGNGLSPTHGRATAGSVSSATSTTRAASGRKSSPRKPGPLPLGVHQVSALAELVAGLQPTRDGGLGAPRKLAVGMSAPLQSPQLPQARVGPLPGAQARSPASPRASPRHRRR